MDKFFILSLVSCEVDRVLSQDVGFSGLIITH